MTVANLCYLINDKNEVLLQFKSKGFGQGKWNGPGGKMESGETIEQAVIREVREETGLEIKNPEKRGELEFFFKGREEWDQVVHVFVANDFSGEVRACDEGELRWFKVDEISYDDMWEDDIYWLPKVLTGEFVKMRFYFNQEGKLQKHDALNLKIVNRKS